MSAVVNRVLDQGTQQLAAAPRPPDACMIG